MWKPMPETAWDTFETETSSPHKIAILSERGVFMFRAVENTSLMPKVGEVDQLGPPVQGWQFKDGTKWSSDKTLECSREVEEEIIRREVEVIKKEEEEERRKIALAREEEERKKREEVEEARRKEQPLAAKVDAAAKEGDLARVKKLQQMDTNGDLSLSF